MNRKRWSARLELTNAIFEYPAILCNRQRCSSTRGMLRPIEFELRHADELARHRASQRRETWSARQPPSALVGLNALGQSQPEKEKTNCWSDDNPHEVRNQLNRNGHGVAQPHLQ